MFIRWVDSKDEYKCYASNNIDVNKIYNNKKIPSVSETNKLVVENKDLFSRLINTAENQPNEILSIIIFKG